MVLLGLVVGFEQFLQLHRARLKHRPRGDVARPVHHDEGIGVTLRLLALVVGLRDACKQRRRLGVFGIEKGAHAVVAQSGVVVVERYLGCLYVVGH
jgi:hypothetical protein